MDGARVLREEFLWANRKKQNIFVVTNIFSAPPTQ